MYKIRPFLKDPNLRLRLDLIDMEEYRLLNGWSRDKKKGSDRFDRIPLTFVEEVRVDRREDYMQFIPYEIPEEFTAKDFAGMREDSGAAGTDGALDSDGSIDCGADWKAGKKLSLPDLRD